MVLEILFNIRWIKKNEHALVLGFLFSLIGVLSAKIIFPKSTGIMSIGFTALLLFPYIRKLIQMEEKIEIKEKKFSIKQIFKDHYNILKIYLLIFFGSFFAYLAIGAVVDVESIPILFESQAKNVGIVGYAAEDTYIQEIIFNNLLVLLVCFLLSLVYGGGAIIFLIWNASVWGVAFAYFIRSESIFILFTSLPHITTEAFAYISAAIVGGVVSKAIIKEKLQTHEFKQTLFDASFFLAIGVALIIIGAFIEYYVRFYV